LRKLGCEYGQGYFFSEPLSAEDLALSILHPKCNSPHLASVWWCSENKIDCASQIQRRSEVVQFERLIHIKQHECRKRDDWPAVNIQRVSSQTILFCSTVCHDIPNIFARVLAPGNSQILSATLHLAYSTTDREKFLTHPTALSSIRLQP